MPDATPSWPIQLGTRYAAWGEVAAIGTRDGERFVMLVKDGAVSLVPPSTLDPRLEDRP